MRRRVAITGIGLVSPHGDDPTVVFDALLAGHSAVTRWEEEGAAPTPVARTPFDVTSWFTRLQLSGVDRVSQIAVAAADLARRDAGIDQFAPDTGLYVGTGMGGAAAVEDSFRAHYGSGRVPPLSVPAFMPNAPAAHIAMRQQLLGQAYTYSIACASSAVALLEAGRAVARGDVPCALAGGAEALLVPGAIRAWHAMQTLARLDDDPARASRPFSAERSGLVLGEGAAFLVLEPYDAAVARNARIYAEFSGGGVSCDATHLTKPDAAGQVRALTAALRDSGLLPRDIGYCNAHGTATRIGDLVESEALSRVWGDALDQLAVSSTKSMHGHLLGAAGALEAAITVLSLHRGAIPPNMHCETPDPACALKLVREPGHQSPDLKAAISNSFAFGGTNVTLVFRH
ncbi:beta-ketoacyl-[acyl-carrier-protein] synthase family protein [Rugamonas apoptosis]|uniref:Nodulation protein E n=1 Tax=Rugamonas apoptosis TaxID=2758570 RepID=A0A7W2FFC3_9BURK|nr:beta-ketoacyl-[acyl-carrier-protein] synthase family protein [Rugamonas apoptosis]MBA5690701.1 beta-ketoacyl-[acyl-carrier-protein] synthase family protein [Rugamonas apoptosis]